MLRIFIHQEDTKSTKKKHKLSVFRGEILSKEVKRRQAKVTLLCVILKPLNYIHYDMPRLPRLNLLNVPQYIVKK
jgi:hypothetical protein